MNIVGRNQPCPCGSGLKYKRCHGEPSRSEGDLTAEHAALVERAAQFVATYLKTGRQMASRFSDSEQIAPDAFKTPCGLDITLCADGVALDLREDPSGEVRVAVTDLKLVDALEQLTLGLMKGDVDLDRKGLRKDSPIWRISDLTLVRNDHERPVIDLQFWTSESVASLTPDLAKAMAYDDMQSRLMMHATGLTGDVRKDALGQLEDAVKEFEELLDGSSPESDFQSFLEEHPILLDQTYKTVIPKQQIGMGKEYETDFAVRGVGDRYTFVEIERPTTPIFRKDGDFRADFNHACEQIEEWLTWLRNNLVTAQSKLPGLREPKGLLVIGLRSEFDSSQLTKLEARNMVVRGSYEILTFDDLLERGKLLLTALRRYQQ